MSEIAKLRRDCLAVVPLNEATIANCYACLELNRSDTRMLILSHERLRAELSGATILLDELTAAIRQIDQMLRVPAAEYVPAIGDVFALIDKLKLPPTPNPQEPR